MDVCKTGGHSLFCLLLCWRYTPREPRRTQTCPHVGFLVFSEPPALCLLSPCCGHVITAATMACVAVALCVRMLCFRHAQTHFFVRLYSRAFLGNQYSACGCIALDVFCLRKHCFGRVQNRGATLSHFFLRCTHREPWRTQTCPHVGFLMFSELLVLCFLRKERPLSHVFQTRKRRGIISVMGRKTGEGVALNSFA